MNENCIGKKLAPFNPINIEVADIIIDSLKVYLNSLNEAAAMNNRNIVELGSGDARFLIRVSR